MQLGTLVSALIQIFHSLAMLSRSARLVLLRDLKRLRGHLTNEASLTADNALIRSRLDYCNSLFRGLSVLDLHKLQCVKNILQNCGQYHQVFTYYSSYKSTILVAD